MTATAGESALDRLRRVERERDEAVHAAAQAEGRLREVCAERDELLESLANLRRAYDVLGVEHATLLRDFRSPTSGIDVPIEWVTRGDT